MAFDNDYPNRKDRRKEYRKSKAFDRTCRNHGSCKYCELNRTHNDRKRRIAARKDIDEYLDNTTK